MGEWNTSHTLLKQVTGDSSEESWQRFADTYRPLIYSIVVRCGVRHEDAEELVQDVLVKVWKALDSFVYQPERCKFRTWLSRVKKNATLSFLDLKAQRNRAQNLDDGETHILSLATAPALDQSEETEWMIFIASRALENLRKVFSDLHLSCYTQTLEERSVEEIAEDLGIKENTVYVYRKKVQQAMSREVARLNAELDG